MVDYRLELVIIPVTDVDRAVAFYGETLGWPVDFNSVLSPELHFVQVTPPGSACSIAFGTGLTDMEPGSQRGIQIVIPNADDAYEHLRSRGVDATPVDEQAWGRFVTFSDPDGNVWALQELPPRD